MSNEVICVGSIGGSYGVNGELRIKSFCAIAEDIETYSPLTREDGTGSYTIAIVRAVKGGFVIRMPEISTKEQADAMKGVQLYARRDQLPSLPDDEYYHSDLTGLRVRYRRRDPWHGEIRTEPRRWRLVGSSVARKFSNRFGSVHPSGHSNCRYRHGLHHCRPT